MRHLFIANPQAGKKKANRALENEIRKLNVPWEIAYTQKAGDARRIARAAAETGEEVRIYACGGDGTLNEVVNGAAGYPNAAVTNIPMGTGNDFLKIFGPDWKKGFSDLAALAEGPQCEIDLIDCSGRLGIDVVCAGIDARIAADVEHYKRLPLVRGMGAYIASLIVNVLFKGIARPMVVDAGAIHYEGNVSIICMCNGRYYGGGFMPVGDNMPDDNKLESLVVPKVSILTFARLVGAYAKGRYHQFPDLIWTDESGSITFRTGDERNVVVCVDGEILEDKAFTLKLSEKKVSFFYPAGYSYALSKEDEISTH